ncbi:MFS transporter [Chloroflexota bacterium]
MRKPAIFYGYKIATAGFIIQAVGIGTYITFGVFFKPIIDELGWSRAALSGAQSLAILVSGVVGILIGRLNDKYGPRVLMSVTSLCFGLGLLAMAWLNDIWQVYIFYGILVGVGMSSINILPLTAIARWFVKKRGLMSGLVKSGTGFGQFAIPLVVGALIYGVGWRNTYILIGLAVILLLVTASQVLRKNPESMGLEADGEKTSANGVRHQESGATSREAMHTLRFWLILFSIFATRFCLASIMLHLIPHVTDIGILPVVAAGILSTIGGVSIGGRITAGFMVDRIGSRNSLMICTLILVLTMLWIQYITVTWMFFLFAVVYGFIHGGINTIFSPIVADYFGTRAHGTLLGVIMFGAAGGSAFGTVITGHVFDLTLSYGMAFWLLTGVATLSFLMILLARQPKTLAVSPT